MSETETRGALTSGESLHRWTSECGSCDAGLPMACTCPEGDHRAVILALWRERDRARALAGSESVRALNREVEAARLRAVVADYEHRISWDTTCETCARLLDSCSSDTARAERAEAEADRLRAVVEAVQALADDMETQAAESTPVMGEVWTVATREVRRALAPVSSPRGAGSDSADYGGIGDDVRPEDAVCLTCGRFAVEHTRGTGSLYGVCPAPVLSWANAYADPDQAHDSISPAVSSSGEAESGHTLTEHGTTDCPVEHRGHVEYRDKTPGFVDDIPTPVSSGGQEDGEGEPKLFRLVRDRDVSGVSGTGLVAWGVRFPDGRVATRWHAEIAQTCTWDSIEHVEAIHGHGGATRVEWLAARPVLSRDALRAAILSARDSSGNLVEYLSSTTAEYVADAILAGGEQA